MCPSKDFNKPDDEKQREAHLKNDPFLIKPGREAKGANPKLVALREEIIEGIRKSVPEREPDDIDLEVAAELAGMTVEEFKVHLADKEGHK
jgi:septum formation topological specificity factor MinE